MPVEFFKKAGIEPEDALIFLWENLKIAACIVSEDHKFLAANLHLCEILGYSEYELQELKFDDITSPQDVEPDNTMMDRLNKGIISQYSMVKTYITKSATLVQMQLFVTPIRNKEGKVVYFLSQVTPILKLSSNEWKPIPVKPVEDLTWKKWVFEHGWKIIALVVGFVGWLWNQSVENAALRDKVELLDEILKRSVP